MAYAAHRDEGVLGQYSYNRAETRQQQHTEELRRSGDHQTANRLEGFRVVRDHCNQNTVTLVNENTREVIVAFRGTMSSWNGIIYDHLANNIAVAFTSFGLRRPRTALAHTQAVINTFGPGYNYTVTGHSLGGSNAEFVSRHLGVNGVAFNGGSGVYNRYHDPRFENRHVNYRVRRDWVSGLDVGETVTIDPIQNMNGHSLKNFIQYERNNHITGDGSVLGGIDFSNVRIQAGFKESIEIGSITGAVFSGSIATLHANGIVDNTSTITMQDFAVALLLAVFGRDPAFSLDPWEPTNPDGPWLRCVFYPNQINQSDISVHERLPFALSQTAYGQTMFEADWLLKQLSMGVDLDNYSITGPFPSPLPIRVLSQSLLNLGLGDKLLLESLQSIPSNSNTNECYTRLWITVDQDLSMEGVFSPHEISSVPTISYIKQTDLGSTIAMRFSEVKLGVQVMRMVRGVNGELKDSVDPRLLEPNSSDSVFARLMSMHYDEVASHYPTLRRLKELAKLQAIAKWMVENDVEVDVKAALAYIQGSMTTTIEKVPALERKTDRARLYGGVNLSVRQGHHERTKPSFALEQNVQDELKNMIHSSAITGNPDSSSKVIPFRFIRKKHCCVCDRPLDFASLYNVCRGSSDTAFCDEHHPDGCYECMLPLYVDPITLKKDDDGHYRFISAPDSIGHDGAPCRYHLTCFTCAVCNKQINDQIFSKDPDVLHVYYHPHCYSPISSFIPRNRPVHHDTRNSNVGLGDTEQMELQQALLNSLITYEESQKQQTSGKSAVNSNRSQAQNSVRDGLSKNSKSTSSYKYIPVPLSQSEAEKQLQETIQSSITAAQEAANQRHQLPAAKSMASNALSNYSPSSSYLSDPCPFCGNKFNKQSTLEEHVQLHLDMG